MIQVNLKLKLSKIQYVIKVTYNTFEKATYDQYLMASLALHTRSETSAYKYIDEITGSGSLNPHFKKLYDESHKLSQEELNNIMQNSMYPTLKIDKSNSYVYYPDIDVSVFHNKIYHGDFGKYEDLIEKMHINEKVVECEINEKSKNDNAEPYLIQLDNNDNNLVKVKLSNEWIPLAEDVFKAIYVNDLSTSNLSKFCGTIHETATGDGWSILTNAAINNMFANKNYFYDKGDHCLIRNYDVKKTIVANVAGLDIFKEEILSYENNKKLCEQALDILQENNAINEFKTKSLIVLLQYVDDLIAQDIINYVLERKDSKELALVGIDLLKKGIEKNWGNEALNSFMKYATSELYGVIYKANPNLVSDIQILISVNPDYLIPLHKQKVEKYKQNINKKIDTIKKIIGEVTASGMRENIKKLKANCLTKRFSKLANKYIGHSKINYETSSLNELDKFITELTEMQDLMQKLKVQLDAIDN